MPPPTLTDSAKQRPALSAAKQALLAKWTGSAASKPASQSLPRRPDATRAPLSFGQQRLWFLEQLVPDSSVYNMHDAVRIRGRVDAAMLQRVLTTLSERHETLRTAFVVVDGHPQQVIAPPQPFYLSIEDLRHVPAEQRHARADEILQEETKRPFDLDRSPLFRARLVRLADDDQILVWTMHHIISDGWSLGVIIKEVLTLCSAYQRGQANPLPPLPIQFGDYCTWQQDGVSRKTLAAQIDYWRKELGGEVPTVTLPTDRPRPALPTYAGARRVTRYPLSLAQGLNDLARQHNATLFMVLLSAFDVLLHRYSGVERIFVGVPVANRNRSDLHDLIGYFVNTLVLRGELNGNPEFVDLLKQVRGTALTAYDRQDVPFEMLVEELHPERGLNKPPFFQVMFVLQNEPMPKVEEAGLSIEPYEIHNGSSKFDLLLNIVETPHGLEVGIEYSTDLFAASTVDRMLDHYRRVLESVVANPRLRVGEVPLLGPDERRQVVETWNATRQHYLPAEEHILHRLIEEQVKRTPVRPALRFGATRLTYAEVNRRANRLAHRLRSLGIGRDTIVAVAMERSVELVIALVAVLKAGGAYLPLDLEYPPERLSYMLDDSRAPVLICAHEPPEWARGRSINIVSLSGDAAQFAAESEANPTAINVPTDLAYVIYTSGSTGRPKGAMNTHAGISNRLLWMQAEYRLNDDRVLQKTPYSFDVSVWEFFWPLLTGAELVVAPPGAHRDSAWLARIIRENEITTLHFVPSMLQIFLSDPLSASCDCLRRVICSGEALGYELQRQFFARFRGTQLFNLYGPTEASVDVTHWDCSVDTGRATVPIGRPIANTAIYILDAFRQPTPIGVPGELYIGGIGVGRGYLNRTELTAERFVPDPFSSDPSARLYRTGDLARFWNDGAIEFLGRIDHQVKIRGLRIELNEIEHAILQDAAVRETVVVARQAGSGNATLCAYLSLRAADRERDQVEADVSEWRHVFDDAYAAEDRRVEPTQNFAGWNSSYTGEAISDAAMAEWVESSIQRIREQRPQRVLEIGCGTGLLLFPLLGHVEEYVGTDISPRALAYIRDQLAARATTTKVDLHEQPAHQTDSLPAAHFDLIVVHSVAQYFPDLAYFEHVLGRLAPLLKPDGQLFLGDLRNLNLAEPFAMSVEHYRSEATTTVAELRDRAQRAIERDGELSIAPEFFGAASLERLGFAGAHVMLRRGQHATEMVRYRYDALLYKRSRAAAPNEAACGEESSWDQLAADPSQLTRKLAAGLSVGWRIADIPNARVFADVQLARAIEQADAATQKCHLPPADATDAVDPESLWSEWSTTYRVVLSCAASGRPECFDAVFLPKHAVWAPRFTPSETKPLRLASNPAAKKHQARVVSRLKQSLAGSLPDYMVPGAFVVLQQLPLSPNGKVDRAALPDPGLTAQRSERPIELPATPTEEAVAEIWSELLNVRPMGVTEDFFELGGHSLLAAQMIIRLREKLGREVPLRALFQTPTIRGLLHALENDAEPPANAAWVQMQKDIFLPAHIAAPTNAKAPTTRMLNTVFLTGATGFLGAFLLRDLLRDTKARVVCLVRAKTPAEGTTRLTQALQRYEIADGVDFARVEVVVGELAKPRFGLSPSEFATLAARVDAIYHCAAEVNFVADYHALRAANVGGTTEVIKLGLTYTIKPVHLVSTIYSLTAADRDDGAPLDETTLPRRGERLSMGYLQTKWVAERLAESARDRGLPVTIYRPGRVSGAKDNGACQDSDFYWSLVRACLKLGAMPENGLDEILTPVDTVSRAIVKLSLDSPGNCAYHVLGEKPLLTAALHDGLTSFGYRLAIVPYEQWRATAIARLQADSNDAAAKLGAFLFNDNSEVEPTFCAQRTAATLRALGLDLPMVADREAVHRQAAYFCRSGFFAPPDGAAEANSRN